MEFHHGRRAETAGDAAVVLALRWVITGQQRRCPMCLRLLTNPIIIGTPPRNVPGMVWHESTCPQGRGLLRTAEFSPSYSRPQCLSLDDSWSVLFCQRRRAALMTLELRHVSKRFSDIPTVEDVSFSARGEQRAPQTSSFGRRSQASASAAASRKAVRRASGGRCRTQMFAAVAPSITTAI